MPFAATNNLAKKAEATLNTTFSADWEGQLSYACMLNLRLMLLGLANLTVAVVLFARLAWFASALLQWHEASS